VTRLQGLKIIRSNTSCTSVVNGRYSTQEPCSKQQRRNADDVETEK